MKLGLSPFSHQKSSTLKASLFIKEFRSGFSTQWRSFKLIFEMEKYLELPKFWENALSSVKLVRWNFSEFVV